MGGGCSKQFPFVPLGGSVRIGVAIFSYDGNITFGVTGDRDTAADIGVLCRGIEESMQQLAPSTSSEKPAPRSRVNAPLAEVRR